MKNILLTGGSGFIGSRLTKLLLDEGYSVAWLSRRKKEALGIPVFEWDIKKGYIEEGAILWADAIMHLAGENISAKRWTNKRKQQIMQSRVQGTNLLKKYLEASGKKMQVIITASAIGYYGNRKNEELFETSAAGEGFLSESCVEWEQAAAGLSVYAERFVTLRIGIVLDAGGGAMKELTKTLPFGIAPVLGNGKQIYSWIMLEDVCGIIHFAAEHKSLQGTYNCVAPHPVSQKELMNHILLKQKRKALLFPVPAFMLRILLGEMSVAVLYSARVSCKKILDEGYRFISPNI